MVPRAPSHPNSLADRLGHVLHRFFLPLLVSCYGMAAWWPEPGLALREATLVLPTGGAHRAPMLLLGLLLFCAAVTLRWSQIQELVGRPGVLLVALLVAWLGPAAIVGALGAVLPKLTTHEATSGMLVGLALVASMPVANSSVGWSQNAGGNVALSLGLVVLSILLSPLATPHMLHLMGLVLSADDTQKIERVVAEFSGWRFIAWVIVPSLAGGAVAWLAGGARIEAARGWIRLITLADLLLLNYANACLALPNEPPGALGSAAVAGGLVSLMGLGLALLAGRLRRVDRASQSALLFGLSMKHTGLALVVAGEVLADQPRVILVILLATLIQHLVAAGVDRYLQATPGAT
jgi:BASS family bile acid:Na+ symporter